MQNDKTGAVLEDLIETLEDGRQGFLKAADTLDGEAHGDLVQKMRGYSEQRATFSTELRSLAAEHGFEISEEGSMGGSLHRGWMSLKDAVTGDDPSAIVGAAESGEDHAVADYEDALGQELPADVRTVVERQAGEIRQAHDEVRSLRDAL